MNGRRWLHVIFLTITTASTASEAGPPRLLEFAFPAEVGLGDEIIVPCVVRKATAGPYRITWQKDGVSLEGSGRRVSVSSTSSKSSSTLRIAGLQPEDVGNYTCAASNAFGSDSFTASLVVHDAPKINEFKFPANLSPGDTVAVICVIKKGSAGPFELSWQKDGRPLEPTASLAVTSQKGGPVSTLTIVDVSARDSGNYTCVARNSAGSDRYSAHLAVTASPKLREFAFPPESTLGEQILVSCAVRNAATGPHRMTWLKDGKALEKSDRVSVSAQFKGTAAIMIADLRPEDVGNYTCVASNAFGSDSFTAALVVQAQGPFELTWRKDGLPVQPTATLTVASHKGGPLSALSIVDLAAEDSGNYTCVARNAAGSDEFSAYLAVKGPPKIREFKFPADISPGETALVGCVIAKGSAGPFELSWLKDGRPLSSSGSPRTAVSPNKGGPASTLTIVDVSAQDSGNYTCVARNAAGSDSFSAFLAVTGPPRLLEFSFPAEVGLGDEIIVSCVVRKGTAGPYTLSWHKDGTALKDSGRVSASSAHSKSSVTLRIAGLQPEDVGNYTCAASNPFGSDSFTAPLVVNDAPKIQEFKFPANLSPGDTVVVSCVIRKGSAGPFELWWRKDDRPLELTSSLTVTSPKGGPVSTITIVDVSARESGNYTCVARNAAGSDRYTAHLAVTGSTGPYTLTWLKDGAPVESSDHVTVSVKSSSTALSIDGVRVEDVGNYTCEASNAFGSDALTLPLLIAALPVLREFSFPPEVTLGEHILVSCAVKKGATGLHHMTWLKDGKDIENSDRVSVLAHFSDGVTLRIANLRPEDVGNYTCVARNSFGSDSFTAPLVVQAVSLTPLDGRTFYKLRVQCFGQQVVLTSSLAMDTLYKSAFANALRRWTAIVAVIVITLNWTNAASSDVHAPEPQTSGFQPNLALGDDAIASCFVPKASWHGEGLRMTWTKENDGDDLSANGRVSFLRASKSSITLGISDVRREDIGNYTCAVFYGASTASVTVPLTISEPPKIKEFKFPGNLSPGDTVAVSCVVKKGSAGPFELFWMKDGIPVELTASVAVSSHKGGPLSTLSIVDVSGEHSGNYTCVARNAAGSDEYSAHLAVTGAPKLQSAGFPHEVSLGEEIVATCSVKKGSTGPYALTWLKGGAPLENSGHVTVSFTASATSLSIGGVRVDDVGNYTCKAANSFGSDTLTLPLLIAGEIHERVQIERKAM
ncbi:hypothetical protein HPB49_017481 [Dermacentor silvarum]|uniref:Uncharacterized protein n=1 Tax=Dermacentor silvarum TaxID=543639 RepID=A0ACB8DPX8_DERSI|nr:hypothetical protein HPB49_017481 [Dermacentor silvarum]